MAFDFLEAKHVGLGRGHEFEQALFQDRADAIDVPRDEFHQECGGTATVPPHSYQLVVSFFQPGLHECAVHLLCASFWFPIHRIQLSLNSLSWAITLTMPARPVLFQNVREADTLAGSVGRLPAEASGVETFPATVTA